MTDKVITSVDQVSREWLTSTLTKSGALTNGEVESFEFGEGQGNWSTSANLFVKYTDAATGSLPERLFLKMVNTDLDDEYFGDSEVTYYTRDYIDVHEAPLLRCYDAAYSKELNRYHLLLDDVSETHVTAAEKEPTLEYGLALAEGLATLHARWWGAKRPAEAGAPIHSEGFIKQFIDVAAPGVEHIIREFSSELKPHWPEAMRELFAKHPQTVINRARDLNGFTLIHGDVGAYNVLVPRHADADYPLYIIDRQPFNWSLTTWLGVYDLAYAIVLDWDIALRRKYENPILKHYHEHLLHNGILDYSWEQLYNDYRLCVAMGVYIATEYCRGGVMERLNPIWLPMLQRALTACDDLECSALWNES
jgi:hypothetical protein